MITIQSFLLGPTQTTTTTVARPSVVHAVFRAHIAEELLLVTIITLSSVSLISGLSMVMALNTPHI